MHGSFGRLMFAGALAACFLSLPGPATARQQERRAAASPPTITRQYDGVALGQILRELHALVQIDLRLDPAVEGRPVWVSFEGLTVPEAIDTVLRRSGVNYVTSGLYRDDGQPIRIVAGNPKRSVPLAAGEVTETGEKNVVRMPENPVPATADAPRRQEASPDKELGKETLEPTARGTLSGEAHLRIEQTLEETRKAVEQIPLLPGAATGSALPGGVPAVPILPFPDATGKPIPIVKPIKG